MPPVSRLAGTLVLDLIRMVAATTEPAAPSYSALLSELAPAPADSVAVLRSYFEPSDEDRARDLKVPTDAHRSIAELVRRGSIRVIVTTNFDRLLARSKTKGSSPWSSRRRR